MVKLSSDSPDYIVPEAGLRWKKRKTERNPGLGQL